MSLINKCVAFWRFEEASPGPAVDETGRGNSLTWNTGNNEVSPNVSGLPSQATGMIGYGVRLNSSFLYRTRNDDFDYSSTGFTVGGWVYLRDTIASSTKDPIFSISDNVPATYDLDLYTDNNGGDADVILSVRNTSLDIYTVTVPNISYNDWHYIRGYLDLASSELGLQVDCGTTQTTDWSGTPANITQTVWVGRVFSSWPYAGHTYDAWGFWKRALDTGEATSLCAGVEYPFGECGYLAFGSFEFPRTFHAADDNLDWQIPSIKTGRYHGGHSLAATLREKRLSVRGGLVKGPIGSVSSTLRAALDEIRDALGQQPQDLYIYPDRYWRNARAEMFRNPFGPTHFCRIAEEIEILFVASDPFLYSTTESTDTWSAPTNGETRMIRVGGNAPAQPTFRFTVGGGGAQSINFTLKNTTTDESFTLIGDVTGGQVIAVDTLDQTVKIGTTDEMDLFDGQFPQLNADTNNTLQITINSGTITSLVTTWRNRWY